MGLIYQTIAVGNLQGGPMIELDAMVDTGAADSVLPSGVLEELGIIPYEQISCSLAGGSIVDWGYGSAMLQIDDRRRPCPVIFGPADMETSLLGATTLEFFKLTVDPVNQRLAPVRTSPLGWGGPR
jgi:predicted aspartyl protease